MTLGMSALRITTVSAIVLTALNIMTISTITLRISTLSIKGLIIMTISMTALIITVRIMRFSMTIIAIKMLSNTKHCDTQPNIIQHFTLSITLFSILTLSI